MIKIDLANIDRGGVDLVGSEPASFLDVEDPNGLLFCGNETNYELHVALVNNGILVTGRASTIVKVKCGRCLEEYEQEVINNKICCFYEDVASQTLDLTEDIREETLVCLSQRYLCSEDCKGLCHVCGVNLNKTQCKCKKKTLPEEDPWQALDSLNVKDDSE